MKKDRQPHNGNIAMIRNYVACVFFSGLFSASVFAREILYVFYPSTLDPQSMQDKMTDVIRGMNITAFGRYDDFITKVHTEPPDAVITKTALIHDQLGDYEVSLNGERNGTTEERNVVLSINKQFSIDSVDNETVIGVIDILGRTGMKSFLKQLFPVEPKLKRVSRVGDLLPIVTLDVAAGIMIEDVFVDYFKSTSQLQFSVTRLTGVKNGIVAFAVKKNGNAPKTLAGLKRNDKVICDLFHIEKWK
jgi:hypothetical protein